MMDEDRATAETTSQECAKARASHEVDRQSEESFPASDPPSFNRGAFIGAPKGSPESRPESHTHEISKIAPPQLDKQAGCPQFRNDIGVKEIRIGAKAFECIGETPPQDHPHIYLELGEHNQILCPYCGTLFRFDPSLRSREADPPESLFHRSQ
jgi:uncharacterized Zn-finger protein